MTNELKHNTENSSDYFDRPYRPCVGIIVKNSDKKVFIGQRFDTPNAWQFPQGGVNEGEDYQLAALRELYEETNITSVKIIAQMPEIVYYDIPLHLANKLWNGQYRGQKQTWFLVEFVGNEKEIQLDKHEEIEFSDYRFVALRDTIALTVPFKRDIYEKITTYFAPWF